MGIRLSILEGSAAGTVVYQEFHKPVTSAIGLIALNVGEGNPLAGVFADIDWPAGDHFLQVEVDVNGGSSYQLMGVSQLLSVPYALFATEAESAKRAEFATEAETAQTAAFADSVALNFIAGDGIEISEDTIINAAPSPWTVKEDTVSLRDDVVIAPNGRVTFGEEVGINQTFSFVDLNVRNQAGNSTVFQVEDTTGTDLFEVGRNGNVGINRITNNVTLQVQNKTQGDNNIIANFEKADGGNVFQVQADNDVVVTGDFSVNNGNKNFILDHPLDPANMTLAHNAVESPDHVTYYHGTVRVRDDGTALVSLPKYFEALNADYHYQLTCVGGFAQVYVASEIKNNQFIIAGGKPGMKVSWQVTARRDDPWAHDNPYRAEFKKDPIDKGKYYYPQGYGKGKAFQIGMDDGGKTDDQ
ncbi:MAG: hypothetical protein AAFZ52_07785 [Bacteroidota bacterium]